MSKRTIVLTIAGAATVCFGWVQMTRPRASQRAEALPHKPQKEDARTRKLPDKVVPAELMIRSKRAVVTPDWELHKKQDRERNFFEWRDGKLETPSFASSVSKG